MNASLALHHISGPVCALCEEKLKLADPYLASWFRVSIKPQWLDAHVSWAFRDQHDQEEFYDDKRSDLHFPYSAHNKVPSQAIDLFQIDENNQGVWNGMFFAAINDMNHKNNFPIVWGAQYKDLGDYDHFQLKK